MPTEVKSIIARANATAKMRTLRANIEEALSKPRPTVDDAVRVQRMKQALDELKRTYIFLVVDNT